MLWCCSVVLQHIRLKWVGCVFVKLKLLCCVAVVLCCSALAPEWVGCVLVNWLNYSVAVVLCCSALTAEWVGSVLVNWLYQNYGVVLL